MIRISNLASITCRGLMARPRAASFTTDTDHPSRRGRGDDLTRCFFQLVSFLPLKVPSFKAMVFDC